MYKQIGTDFNCGFGKLAGLTVFQSSFFLLACEQALCLGKKIARKGKGNGALFPLPSFPLDQRPVHRPFFCL